MRRKTELVLAIIIAATSLCSAQNLAINSGFEMTADTDGSWPSGYGYWHGDYSSIVGATSGITPFEGSQMLQCKGTAHTTFPSLANTCEVPQILDVSQYASLIASGNAVVSASAYFNRIAGDAQTDTGFGVSIMAHQGNPSSYPSDRNNLIWLLHTGSSILTDSDLSTWEKCQAQMTLPTNTDYVVVQVSAGENIYNDTSYPEFDGHFVDSVSVTIIPEPVIEATVDIKPGSCPNPLNVKSKGVLPVAVLGTDSFDVTNIDPASIFLNGVPTIRSSLEDVATPVSDANECECSTEGPDGFLDLTLKFETQSIVEALGEVDHGDELVLELNGVLSDETFIKGSDCIIIRGKHKPINRADFNCDRIVDMADFAAFAENWLQLSIVED